MQSKEQVRDLLSSSRLQTLCHPGSNRSCKSWCMLLLPASTAEVCLARGGEHPQHVPLSQLSPCLRKHDPPLQAGPSQEGLGAEEEAVWRWSASRYAPQSVLHTTALQRNCSALPVSLKAQTRTQAFQTTLDFHLRYGKFSALLKETGG